MIVLMIAGVIGFAIGRVITIIIASLFQQQYNLNAKSARTLIVLGSGGEKNFILKNSVQSSKYYLCRSHNRNAGNSKKTKD